MIDILVVGHAPILEINRRFYQLLARRGWTVELVIPEKLPWNGPAVEPPAANDPPIHRLRAVGDQTRYWHFEGLEALVRQRRPKIIILENEPDSRMGCVLGKLIHQLGGKMACISNENDLPPPLAALIAGQIKPALRSLRSRLWSLAARGRIDHVFAICDEGVTTMEALGFAGRTSKMALGFDRTIFLRYDDQRRAAIRSELGLTGPVVAYFGRLVPIKGVHLLIAALGRLRHRKWQLLLDSLEEGHDDYVASLRKGLADAGIADRTIQFKAKHAEMPNVMNAADIVVTPSIWKEQYGRVVPEAMACGAALVVSDAGAIPELIGETGVKVPTGNIDALAQAIEALLADPIHTAALGAAAAERARHHLSIEAQADHVEPVLRRLLAGPYR